MAKRIHRSAKATQLPSAGTTSVTRELPTVRERTKARRQKPTSTAARPRGRAESKRSTSPAVNPRATEKLANLRDPDVAKIDEVYVNETDATVPVSPEPRSSIPDRPDAPAAVDRRRQIVDERPPKRRRCD